MHGNYQHPCASAAINELFLPFHARLFSEAQSGGKARAGMTPRNSNQPAGTPSTVSSIIFARAQPACVRAANTSSRLLVVARTTCSAPRTNRGTDTNPDRPASSPRAKTYISRPPRTQRHGGDPLWCHITPPRRAAPMSARTTSSPESPNLQNKKSPCVPVTSRSRGDSRAPFRN
jgi:hypothetical protein